MFNSNFLKMAALISGIVLSAAVYAEEKPKEVSRRIFEPVLISPLGIGADRLAKVSASALTDVKVARGVLADFLRSLEESTADSMQFVTPELAKEKPTKLALSESLIPFESSILSIALSDFEFLRSDLLKLEYYAVVFIDGNLVIDEREAELRRFGAGWKVSKITKAEAYMCHFEGD